MWSDYVAYGRFGPDTDMNMSSYASSLTSRVSVSPLTVPTLVWECYLEYLWFYEPSSWVARTAYGFRVLAFLLVFPITVLTLLVRTALPMNHESRSS